MNEELVSVITGPLYSQCTILVMQIPKIKSLQVVTNFQIFEDIPTQQSSFVFPRVTDLQLD
jgi:hypothetical protein